LGRKNLSKKYQTIQIKKKQHIAQLTINRPKKLNAINYKMLEEILKALIDLEKDTDIKCLVITGNGKKSFSVGADINELKKFTSKMAEDFSLKGQKAFSKLECISKPVIAAIDGFALGGGLELALACDFRIATNTAKFGCPEIKLGLLPAWGATQRLQRIIGLSNSKKLIMTGEMIKANEAFLMGLVDKVVFSKELEYEVENFAKKFNQFPSETLKKVKSLLGFTNKTSFNVGLKKETETFVTLFASEKTRKKINAFVSRRNKK
jgi:enoyl-CoA hydratase/carnithine racemase